MAKLIGKGTILEQEIATVFTAVAQVISIDTPEPESEAFESDTLDNGSAGIPYTPSGRTEGGSLSGELFLDPALTGHKALLSLLTTPALQAWKLKFANSGPTTWPFSGAGFKLGAKIELKEGVKASFSIKLNGIPTFPA